MRLCRISAEEALYAGDRPVGAALINHKTGDIFRAKTSDLTDPHILGHAEILVYNRVAKMVGADLSKMTLVTTAQPCSTCTPPYAEGKIGNIVYATPRRLVWALINTMRHRKINLPELIADGKTNTIVTEGYEAAEALELFSMYAKRTGENKRIIRKRLQFIQTMGGISTLESIIGSTEYINPWDFLEIS